MNIWHKDIEHSDCNDGFPNRGRRKEIHKQGFDRAILTEGKVFFLSVFEILFLRRLFAVLPLHGRVEAENKCLFILRLSQVISSMYCCVVVVVPQSSLDYLFIYLFFSLFEGKDSFKLISISKESLFKYNILQHMFALRCPHIEGPLHQINCTTSGCIEYNLRLTWSQ